MNERAFINLRDWARSHLTAVAVACVFVAALGLYLLTQHTAHVLGAAPFALMLVCPLMHFFMPGMHGGHGTHEGSHAHDNQDREYRN